jgi:cytochrome b involved in lipid metabolism
VTVDCGEEDVKSVQSKLSAVMEEETKSVEHEAEKEEEKELDYDNLPGDLRNKMKLLDMDNIEDILQEDPEMQQIYMMSAIEAKKQEQKTRVEAKAAEESKKEE